MRAILIILLLCAGCAPRPGFVWDGRRGYDGNGDYGYDLEASRAEARGYRARAARTYPSPGPPDDPWGPHIREAAGRFGVPERWIRAVMRQESGGRQYGGDGLPITSRAGAMGLMQVMPRTYDTLAARHGLGQDPYEPRDNILAGAAYIRLMHDRFGAPGFLAAYNAGPERVAAYLAGVTILPDETINYVANVAPQLGTPLPVAGPFAELAMGGGTWRVAGTAEADRAYAGGGMRGADYPGWGGEDPTLRAFDGGGLVTPEAPTGLRTPDRW
ncbi:lytic transglycosylase domain-containing protein [Paracraurococcus ruber]|uniref:lytic transglycosylase domain-containing protein n=1 Tax=Paracraurococcus ruber TaxID=77675 RepID=UPI003083F899